MMDEFCPPHECQKLEDEFWNIKQKDGDNAALTARFKQLSIICPDQVKTSDMAIKKYIRALPECVADFVHAAKTATIEETYLLAAEINDNRVKLVFGIKPQSLCIKLPPHHPPKPPPLNRQSPHAIGRRTTTAAPVTRTVLSPPLLLHFKPYRLSNSPTTVQLQLPTHRLQSVHTQAPTRLAQHVLIIIRWVLPVVSAPTATCTATSLPTAVLVPTTPHLPPLLIKLCSQPCKAIKRLRHPRSTPEFASHVVIPTTLRTCARTGW
ncbi:hypothetical protein HanIR_Chr03g0105501 [Helianthus annuus]|nr:hypothetical protein HanIR_Chr03g0105501 [Helianthus annuus]